MGRSISLIMSAYNEGTFVESAIRKAQEKLKQHEFDYEILIFDDASTDNTGLIVRRLAREDSRISVFRNSRNMNIGYNFARGIKVATKTYCGAMPCNGLIAPESYDSILTAIKKSEKDIVIAYIANPKARPLYRRVISRVNTMILNLLFGLNLKYYHLNFYRTDLLKKLPTSTVSYALLVELLVCALASGASYIQVPFYRIERSTGKSKALRPKNLMGIFETYLRLFWRIRILKEKIN